MKHFRRLALALVGTLILLIGIAYFIYVPPIHADPVHLLFTYPSGTACDHPCLFGVQPGKTSYADAFALLRAHPLTCDFDFDLAHGMGQGPGARVILHFGMGKHLSQIDLVRTGPRSPMTWGSLGSVVAQL